MQVLNYLFFNGNCEEAVKFYERALGAKIEMLSRYKESPEPMPEGMVPKGWDDKVMHVSMRIGESTVMASDSPDGGTFKGIQLSINTKSLSQAKEVFAALSEGGQVTMPLDKTFWSDGFGSLNARLGAPWMANVDR